MTKWFDKKSTTKTSEYNSDISKCGAVNRIGIILSYYNKWLKFSKKDKLKTGMYEYIHKGVKATPSKKDKKSNNNNNTKKKSKDKSLDPQPSLSNDTSNPNFNYSSVKLLDDYHHILYDYDNLNDLESIYDYLTSKYLSSTLCKPQKCKILQRNNRDRWSCSMNNFKRIEYYQGYDASDQVYILKLLDRIYSTLIYSFDCGYKLNKKDLKLIDKKNAENLSVNMKLKYIHDQIIKPKRKKIRKIRGAQRYRNNKFISFYDLNENDHHEEEEEDESSDDEGENKKDDIKPETAVTINLNPNGTPLAIPKKKKYEYIEYSFGFPYKYWKTYKNDEWYIPSKYKDLRTEIVNNEVHKISINQFNDELKNAIDLINCKRGRLLKCKYLVNNKNDPQREQIGIDQDEKVTIDHILALIFTTNYDQLYRKFIATFKKRDDNESNIDLIKRHSELHNLGRLSFEMIHLYGIDINDKDQNVNDTKLWFHGFDQPQIFHDTFVKFEAITSTTTNLNVALNYSCGIGIILKLTKSNDTMTNMSTYFDCRWISDYSNEYENIFIQNEFKFQSILNITLYHDYEWYLKVLSIMKMMFNGMFFQDETLKLNERIYRFLNKLVNEKITQQTDEEEEAIFGAFVGSDTYDDDTKEEMNDNVVPRYVIELFKKYCEDKNGLIMNVWSMNIDQFKMFNDKDNIYYGYKLIKDLFINKDDDEWIYFNKLTDLYQNVQLICIYNVDWINGNNLSSIKLNDNFGNKLLSFLSLDNSSLIDLWIYLPNEDEMSMKEFINKYGSQFEYIQWKPQIQQKKIPGLREKLGDIKTLCITYEGEKNNKSDEKAEENENLDVDDGDDDDDSDSDSY